MRGYMFKKFNAMASFNEFPEEGRSIIVCLDSVDYYFASYRVDEKQGKKKYTFSHCVLGLRGNEIRVSIKFKELSKIMNDYTKKQEK